MYDWSIALSDGIAEQLEKVGEGSNFAYVSHIIWMMIHQNSGVFKNLTLVQTDENGSQISVDRWTEELRPSADYYIFVENFLVPAMSLLVPAVPRLTPASKLYLRMPHGETGDWFFAEEGTFVRLYGFSGAPFLLPVHVTDWVFSMEYAR